MTPIFFAKTEEDGLTRLFPIDDIRFNAFYAGGQVNIIFQDDEEEELAFISTKLKFPNHECHVFLENQGFYEASVEFAKECTIQAILKHVKEEENPYFNLNVLEDALTRTMQERADKELKRTGFIK